jgi:hypothetical protein
MMTFLIWVVFIFCLLAVIGGVVNAVQKGLKPQEFIGLILMMFVVVVFGFIAITGSFSL